MKRVVSDPDRYVLKEAYEGGSEGASHLQHGGRCGDVHRRARVEQGVVGEKA